MRRAVAAGVDLSNAEQQLGDWFRGSVSLVDALWAVIEPQAKSLDVDRDTFERNCCGDTLDEALEALIAGIVDFFPSQRGRLLTAAAAEIKREIAELVSKTQTENSATQS